MSGIGVNPIPGIPQTVNELLTDRATHFPDRLVLVDRVSRLTCAALDELVGKWGNALATRGVVKGDRVATSLPNGVQVVAAFLATLRLGAVWVGINRVFAAPEKAQILRDSGAKVFLTSQETVDQLQSQMSSLPELQHVVDVEGGLFAAEIMAYSPIPPVDVDPFALAAIAYTSGTTGIPKGVMHSQRNMLLPGLISYRERGNSALITGVYLPLTVLNLQILGPVLSLISGGVCVCIDRVDPDGLVEWIEKEQVQSMSAAAATFHDIILRDDIKPERLRSLTALGLGASGVPDWIFDAYQQKFGYRCTTGYGLSEAPTIVTNELADRPRRKGASGVVWPHLKVFICDENGDVLPKGEPGEVVVCAADSGQYKGVYAPFLGYWNNPEATSKALRNGQLFTGDIGWFDEEDQIHIEDRRVDLIIRGGANVYPAEIERVLNADDRILDSAVVGKNDPRLGQIPVVFVICVEPESITADEVKKLCADNLAKYKVPSEVIFVDAFPRNHMGKIIRQELRSRINPDL